ncbi:PqqD family protein [Sphingomonas donggukensis]|uniref:PqqD family protein n=1 Tax=Sphingomonas donggukensis TaxID=2949093 RepID=A0ABY4TWC2_9SPHN|nr:PqqD family protein [Sphingomonas donggukensis]URW76682.1 PqqD family protein [Sphingomonas donggukensis]
MSQDYNVARNAGLLEAEVDGELLGLHVDKGACYGFNPTATRVWALIETPTTLTALCETLAQEFAVDPADAQPDVLAMLRDLEREGLVTLTPA